MILKLGIACILLLKYQNIEDIILPSAKLEANLLKSTRKLETKLLVEFDARIIFSANTGNECVIS